MVNKKIQITKSGLSKVINESIQKVWWENDDALRRSALSIINDVEHLLDQAKSSGLGRYLGDVVQNNPKMAQDLQNVMKALSELKSDFV